MTTYLIYSDIYLEHNTGMHPENKMRLENSFAYLKRKGWLDQPAGSPNNRGKLNLTPPRKATVEEIAYIHNKDYIRSVEEMAAQGFGYLDPDTPVSKKSYEAALFAAGGVLTAADKVMETQKSNAFCLVRPPGHHSLPDQGMGFCLFNNIAIGARYVQKKHGIKKVAIIDWDRHHGNGTQEAFYEDDTVLFCSLHRYPYYPGSGASSENGQGKGKGFTANLPLDGHLSSQDYIDAFAALINNAVKPFKPEFIFISAGFDTYAHDPLGGLGLEAEDYASLTKMVMEASREAGCQGRIVSALEGGYDLQGLPLCIEAHLAALSGNS